MDQEMRIGNDSASLSDTRGEMITPVGKMSEAGKGTMIWDEGTPRKTREVQRKTSRRGFISNGWSAGGASRILLCLLTGWVVYQDGENERMCKHGITSNVGKFEDSLNGHINPHDNVSRIQAEKCSDGMERNISASFPFWEWKKVWGGSIRDSTLFLMQFIVLDNFPEDFALPERNGKQFSSISSAHPFPERFIWCYMDMYSLLSSLPTMMMMTSSWRSKKEFIFRYPSGKAAQISEIKSDACFDPIPRAFCQVFNIAVMITERRAVLFC